MRQDPRTKNLSIDNLVTNFLFTYRNTPHTVTGKTPFQIKPNTLLDNLIHNKENKNKSDDEIYFKNGSNTSDSKFSNKKDITSFHIRQKVCFKLKPGKYFWNPAIIKKKTNI